MDSKKTLFIDFLGHLLNSKHSHSSELLRNINSKLRSKVLSDSKATELILARFN
jgi:hypothetical protein